MDWKDLLRPESRVQLLLNARKQAPLKGTRREQDFEPVCKLFTPFGAATWLLTECDSDGLAFGLADLGFGTPELGYISLDELASVTGPGGLHIEEDLHFKATKPLSDYADEARSAGQIRA